MSAGCQHCRRFREERDEAIEALRQIRERDQREADDVVDNLRAGVPALAAREALIIAELWRVFTKKLTSVTSVERLIEIIWGADAPEAADKSIGVYIHRIRQTLGANVIENRYGTGWRLTDEGIGLLRDTVASGVAPSGLPGGAPDALRSQSGAWFAEEMAILRTRAASGDTAAEISAQLAAAGFERSRHAVIGKAARAGVTLHGERHPTRVRGAA